MGHMGQGRRLHNHIRVLRLGTIPYRDGLAVQAHIQAQRQADEVPDTLLLLEHPPVYTRGRRGADGELALGEDFYRAHGIEIVPTDRGGRVTYHGPGQLVGYPIMRVTDIGAHLRTMEAAIVATLAEYGIEARSRCDEGIDYTGVWVEDRKIASIGVHLSRGRLDTWVRGKRDQRPRPVLVDRAVRPDRRDDDLGGAGARPRAGR